MSLLRAGLHVVRRDEQHLQIGLDPPGRVVAPDEPDVQQVLADLASGREPAPRTTSGHRLLRDLLAADLLRTGPEPSSARVVVDGADGPASEALRLLGGRGTRREGGAAVALVVATGEPPRALVDEHLRAGRPHLVVSAGARGFRVGPLVVPGATACLRCVDAHLGEHDPRRAVVVEQLAGRHAAPDDAALETLAIAWAVRDVLRFVDGGRPGTWSATVELTPDAEPERRAWARHPYCGCSWAQLPTG